MSKKTVAGALIAAGLIYWWYLAPSDTSRYADVPGLSVASPSPTPSPSPSATPKPKPSPSPTPRETPAPEPTAAPAPIAPTGGVVFSGRVTDLNTGLPVRASVLLELYDTAHDAWATAGVAGTDPSGNFVVQAQQPTIALPDFAPYKLSLFGTYRVSFKAQGYQLNLWKNSLTFGEATPVVVTDWGPHGSIDASMVRCQSSFDLGCS